MALEPLGRPRRIHIMWLGPLRGLQYYWGPERTHFVPERAFCGKPGGTIFGPNCQRLGLFCGNKGPFGPKCPFWGPQRSSDILGGRFGPTGWSEWVELMVTTHFGLELGLLWLPGNPTVLCVWWLVLWNRWKYDLKGVKTEHILNHENVSKLQRRHCQWWYSRWNIYRYTICVDFVDVVQQECVKNYKILFLILLKEGDRESPAPPLMPQESETERNGFINTSYFVDLKTMKSYYLLAMYSHFSPPHFQNYNRQNPKVLNPLSKVSIWGPRGETYSIPFVDREGREWDTKTQII